MEHKPLSMSAGEVESRKTRTLNLKTLDPHIRRPVKVTVNRIYSRTQEPTDINNNQARILIHPTRVGPPPMEQFDLPPISTAFATLQVFLYLFADKVFGIHEESDVFVSWKSIMIEGKIWRLFYAQFFHFGKIQIFFNLVTLMALGRALEMKIRMPAYAFLIMLMSAISNLLYIFLTDLLCSGPLNEYTVGFSTVMFSLRMIHIFTMDSDANNGMGEPNLIFGFLPVHLPPEISPWQPVLETIFFDVVIIGRCVAANVSGIFAGLVFPWLMKNFRNYIMYPKNPPPPPPKTRPRPPPDDENDNDGEFVPLFNNNYKFLDKYYNAFEHDE